MPKKRSDSGYVMTELAQSAVKKMPPPLPLDENELPFWDAIIAARHTWTQVDLYHACNLARTFWMIEQETENLKKEGSTTWGGKNGTTKVMNPTHSVLEALTRRSTALSQKLQVHAQATIGKPETNRKKNAAKQKISDAFDDDDDLIARPN